MLTVWHQRGREEGRAEGRIEGLRDAVVITLTRRFAQTPARIETALERISDESLLSDLLGEAATVGSLQDFQARLPLWALE